jgi:glycosyltransferase involved in cell wall biosynthesis
VAVLSLDHADFVEPLARERQRRPDAFDEVPNGVDPTRFAPGLAPEIRVRHGIPLEAVVVLACAALDHAHRTKRIDLAIRAVGRLASDTPVHLLVVGDGPMRGDLERQAHAVGIAGRVTFAGSVGHEIAEYYRAADVLVLPSEIEAFPLVLLEAMATGLPVISTSVPGARVITTDGVEGLHVKAADGDDLERALSTVLEMNSADRTAMGAAGRRRVLQQYTWRHSVDRLEECFSRALGA